jgi:hypothetical protein
MLSKSGHVIVIDAGPLPIATLHGNTQQADGFTKAHPDTMLTRLRGRPVDTIKKLVSNYEWTHTRALTPQFLDISVGETLHKSPKVARFP